MMGASRSIGRCAAALLLSLLTWVPTRAFAACPVLDHSPASLQAEADWIIEGTITMVFTANGSDQPEIFIEGIRMLKNDDPDSKAKTANFGIDPCDVDDLKLFRGKASVKLNGKKMRFYGERVAEIPHRRLMFMEAASKPFKAEKTTAALTTHRVQAENSLPNGWHLATSTDGGFSVELPAPFNDATIVDKGRRMYMLAATAQGGEAFLVLADHGGPASDVNRQFDADLRAAGSNAVTFRDLPAVRSRRSGMSDNGKGSYTMLRFRSGGVIYIMSIGYSADSAASIAQQEQHFFDSIVLP
jgi:hypothetical protein